MQLIREAAAQILGMEGRMISGSKSGYRDRNPKNLAVFNANVCTKSNGKIWFGDIDITLSHEKLTELAKSVEENVYVLSEMDARFGNEDSPIFDNAVAIFCPDGSRQIGRSYAQYIDPTTLTFNK